MDGCSRIGNIKVFQRIVPEHPVIMVACRQGSKDQGRQGKGHGRPAGEKKKYGRQRSADTKV